MPHSIYMPRRVASMLAVSCLLIQCIDVLRAIRCWVCQPRAPRARTRMAWTDTSTNEWTAAAISPAKTPMMQPPRDLAGPEAFDRLLSKRTFVDTVFSGVALRLSSTLLWSSEPETGTESKIRRSFKKKTWLRRPSSKVAKAAAL
jgi:hypothetical protein